MEIRVLDENTIDKIAAGEVVDKPASVVKELVENAMDSGADAITVEIKEGGIALIRVTDNGNGIPKSEVAKAFLRHATSKIRTTEDLQTLSTLGFRGEALSSICAVSQVELISKTENDITGIRYAIDGGVEKESEEIGAPSGTTILVRNLFYNVPARKKFLKTPQTEGGYISDLMEHMALSHPYISFKYVINGQLKFHTSGNGNLKDIIYRIYGRDISNELIFVEKSEGAKKIAGFLGSPVIGRANRNFETYFINGRYIKNSIISKAAEDAYKTYLMQHKYPFFVLHITLEPDCMDVNVHPSKMEVRFHDAKEISDFVYQAIYEALSGKEMLKKVVFEDEKESSEKTPEKEIVPEPFEVQARKSMLLKEEPIYSKESSFEPIVKKETPKWSVNELLGGTENKDIHSNIIKKESHILVEKPVQMNFFDEKIITREFRDEYRILGQVFDTYWILAFRDKMLIIDQHAAHEKVKYERLCKQIREKQVVSQQMNPPLILTLSGKEELVLKEYQTYFEEMGFEIEPFGGNEYAVRSIPVDLFGNSAKQMLEEIMDELSQGPLKGEPDVIASKLASMSCKAAVKGNSVMNMTEAQALIDELLTLENPYHCPHGRPTIITMSRYELEKKFSRIV